MVDNVDVEKKASSFTKKDDKVITKVSKKSKSGLKVNKDSDKKEEQLVPVSIGVGGQFVDLGGGVRVPASQFKER